MSQQQRAQHLLLAEALGLQELTHLRNLQLEVNCVKPFVDTIEHISLSAIHWILQLLTVCDFQLKFPNQS
jgi:hypothetical protein